MIKKTNKKTVYSNLADLGENNRFDDIVKALKEDHKELRRFGETLKSEDASNSEKKEAYKNFSSLLKSHAKSEEKAVYAKCCPVEELTQEAEEGYIEHKIADNLMKDIATTRNSDKWNALVKVLAEVVEHHADEEEKELLPKVKEHFEKSEQVQMSHQFITLREKSQKDITEDNAGVLAKVQAEASVLNR